MKGIGLDKGKSAKQLNWVKKHKILMGLIILLSVALVGGIVGGSNTSDSNTVAVSTPVAEKASSPEVAKLGEAARDGKFEFIVKSVECGKTRVGDTYLGKDAQGQFCFVKMTVKNIGNEEQSLSADNQYIYDKDGKRYSADSEASIYNSTNGSTWYDEINPGNSVSGSIIFDVPRGIKIVTAELHDSAYSGGIKVDLK